jgi:hypothetical protein
MADSFAQGEPGPEEPRADRLAWLRDGEDHRALLRRLLGWQR